MDEFLFRQRPLFLQNWRAAIADPSALLGRGVILLAPNRIIPSNGLVHTGAGGALPLWDLPLQLRIGFGPCLFVLAR